LGLQHIAIKVQRENNETV